MAATTRHAYLFGGPDDGTLVPITHTAESVRVLHMDAAPTLTAPLVIGEYRYRFTGGVWSDAVYGAVADYVYEGRVPA